MDSVSEHSLSRPYTEAERDLIRMLARIREFAARYPDADDEAFRPMLLGHLHSSVHDELLRVLAETPPDHERVAALVKAGLQRARDPEQVVIRRPNQPDAILTLPGSVRAELAALAGKTALGDEEKVRVRRLLREHGGQEFAGLGDATIDAFAGSLCFVKRADAAASPKPPLFTAFFRGLAGGIDDGVLQKPKAVHGFQRPMYPLELEGSFPLGHFLGLLEGAGLLRTTGTSLSSLPRRREENRINELILSGCCAALNSDTAERLWDLWQSLRSAMPWRDCLFGLTLRVPGLDEAGRFVLAVSGDDIGMFLELGSGWVLCPALFSEGRTRADRQAKSLPAQYALTVCMSALVWTLHCLRHRAVEYLEGDGQASRRYNGARRSADAVIARPRVLDLGKTVVARLPSPPPAAPSDTRSSDSSVAPHDRRACVRTFRHPRWGKSVGKSIVVSACKVRGGAGAPPMTVVRLPEPGPTATAA